MNLTKEQRAALKRVVAYMDRMYGIASPYYGCTEDADLLRAMIDSSGTVEPTGGFDLERARGLRDFLQDDCAEVGDIWGEMIAEIERLRPFEIAARDLDSDLTKIAGERDDQATRIKELKADLEQSEICIRARMECIDDQAARIKELEDAHKRAGAKYAKIIRELRSSVYANIPGLKKQWDEVLADGKISIGDHIVGPDQMVPCWQITEERKAALAAMSNLSETISCPDCGVWIGFADIGPHMAVLRAMLREAE